MKKAAEIRQKKIDRYNWVMTSRYKPEPITDIYIHPNTKPANISVYRGNDKRNFELHSPFRFSEFGISELDELHPLIEKKKNVAKTQLLKSLSQRYQGLARLPQELGIQPLLTAPPPQEKSDAARSSKKRKKIESELEIQVPGLKCNRTLPEGVTFEANRVIEQPERGLFFVDGFGDQAFQRWSDIDQAGITSMVGFLMLAAPVKTSENQRFVHDLKIKIKERPDQHLLESKKQKLENLGFHLD